MARRGNGKNPFAVWLVAVGYQVEETVSRLVTDGKCRIGNTRVTMNTTYT